MSERKQHTAASMRNKMSDYYGDTSFYEGQRKKNHKHNRDHLLNPPRRNIKLANNLPKSIDGSERIWENEFNRKEKLRKIQRRLVKPNIH